MAQISEIPNMLTQASPAAAVVLDQMYVACQGQSDSNIWWAWFDGAQWSPQYKFAVDPGTDGPPALAVLGRDSLYMAWKGGTGDGSQMYISTCVDVTWNPPQAVVPANGKAWTSAPPAMVNYNGKLYLAWKGSGTSTGVWMASFDGTAWSNQSQIVTPNGTPETLAGPALAVWNGKLVLAVSGQSDLNLYWAEFDGATWSNQQQIKPASGTELLSDTTPAVVSYGGRLCVAAREKDHSFIAWQTYDGANWDAASVLPLSLAAGSPSLVIFNSNAYLFWKQANRSGIFYMSFSSVTPAAAPYPLPTSLTFSHNDLPDGFGSGASSANWNFKLVLQSSGSVQFSGQYNDTGSVPIITSPTQNYNLVIGVLSADGKVFTFSHSGSVPSAQSGTWNLSATNVALGQDWAAVATMSSFQYDISNSSDLGSVLDSLISAIETLYGWVEDAAAVIAVVA